jgi:proteasome assembly chaperone (PAC2) family protein
LTDHLRWRRRPDLRSPVVVAAFEGWNDAGEAATTAVRTMGEGWGAEPFADIDPEEFFDFTATRPHVQLVDGRTRSINWPQNVFSAARLEDRDSDVVLLSGIEPGLRWRTFCDQIVEVVRETDARMVITLGALLAEVPHTRPVRISGSASDPELAARLGVRPSRYEGPTGIVGVLNTACREQGIATASVWANVPHYVSGIEIPKAALALVQRALTLLNVQADLADLEEASRQFDQNLAEIVAQNAKIKAYVAKLESRDTKETEPEVAPGSDLPPASELVAEIEQFLKQQRPE